MKKLMLLGGIRYLLPVIDEHLRYAVALRVLVFDFVQAAVIKAYTVADGELKEFELTLGDLTDEERKIILDGCLINYNRV